jgi:hypothetical protein
VRRAQEEQIRILSLGDFAEERRQAADKERAAEMQRWLDGVAPMIPRVGGWCVERAVRLVSARWAASLR